MPGYNAHRLMRRETRDTIAAYVVSIALVCVNNNDYLIRYYPPGESKTAGSVYNSNKKKTRLQVIDASYF